MIKKYLGYIAVRPSIIFAVAIAAYLLNQAINSDHQLSSEFLSTIKFEFGYKVLSLFVAYWVFRFGAGVRRHELIEKALPKAPYAEVIIYSVYIFCITLIICFAG